MPFDYKDLANSIVNNGQSSLPPTDTMRMGQIVGFDPNYDGGGPLLSVQLAGDTSPLHGVSYVSSYTPKLNDTVWLTLTEYDAVVQSAISGNTPATNGTPTTSTNGGQGAHSHLMARKVWTDAHLYSMPTGNTPFPLLPTTGGAGLSITCEVLPNNLYKAEISTTILVSGTTSSSSFFSIGVFAPPSTMQSTTLTQNECSYSPANQIAIPSPGYYTLHGSITWSLSDKTSKSGDWTKMFSKSDFVWYVGWETGVNNSTSTSTTWNIQFAPTNPFPKTNKSKTTPTSLTIYNEGPAS
jgi:hypothetical protein